MSLDLYPVRLVTGAKDDKFYQTEAIDMQMPHKPSEDEFIRFDEVVYEIQDVVYDVDSCTYRVLAIEVEEEIPAIGLASR